MYNDSNIPMSSNPLTVLPPVKEPRRYTLAEYLQKLEKTGELYEYHDGIITKLPMARGPHNSIIMNLGSVLIQEIEAAGKKYHVMGGQQIVYFPQFNKSLFPDVIVVTDKPIYYDNNEVLLINPILVFEVLSDSTKKYDRTDKFTLYKSIETLKEYVLVDQKSCHIESFYREEPNLWRDTIVNDISGSLYLKSIGCSIDAQKVYRNFEFKK